MIVVTGMIIRVFGMVVVTGTDPGIV